MSALDAPSATDSSESLADWLELRALKAADRNSSIEDLVNAVRSPGSTEALAEEPTDGEFDRGSEKSQSVAEDAFSEIEDRLQSCGGKTGEYPFYVDGQHIQLKKDGEKSAYLFLLLLGKFGKDAGPTDEDGASLFEEVCIQASRSYFGGSQAIVGSYHFGAPRRTNPRGFVQALNDMCVSMGEGGGCRIDRPKVSDQKDAKLDLTVWLPFADARVSKFFGFGQCATGADWKDKISELQPSAFCEMWMQDTPATPPLPLFFVPFRVERSIWMYRARLNRGILFDRCRIAVHQKGLNKTVIARCRKWSGQVLEKHLRQ